MHRLGQESEVLLFDLFLNLKDLMLPGEVPTFLAKSPKLLLGHSRDF